jgi:hypothetical protein
VTTTLPEVLLYPAQFSNVIAGIEIAGLKPKPPQETAMQFAIIAPTPCVKPAPEHPYATQFIFVLLVEVMNPEVPPDAIQPDALELEKPVVQLVETQAKAIKDVNPVVQLAVSQLTAKVKLPVKPDVQLEALQCLIVFRLFPTARPITLVCPLPSKRKNSII